MCGISGIISIDGAVSKEQLKKMTDAIAHRGPDGEGHWVNPASKAGLGHRRLSIIDLSENGKQPMHYADGRYTITFNGEIYNYIELRKILLAQGYKFHSESDTEVLLALYDQKKEKCLGDLDGMFAFAIWDEKEQELFCARDRFGEKPFYYSYVPGKSFYFASEMKALWSAGVSKQVDTNMLSHYLQTNEVLDKSDLSRTFYTSVKQLDGSYYLRINASGKLTVQKYYDLDHIEINSSITRKEASEKFYELLYSSVNVRLRSDVPVGSSLSGGMDSSSIVMLIDKIKGNIQNQNTFSARFLNHAKDEGKHIHEVTARCKNLTCYEVWPDGEGMLEDFQKLVYHQEEPFLSSSIYAQWKVMECTKQHNTIVLLDGQGADEYLAGYLPYYRIYLLQLYYNNNFKLYDKEWHDYKTLRNSDIERIEDTQTFKMKLGHYKRKLLSQPMPYGKQELRNELRKDVLKDKLKELLRYADRNAMAHSREVRLPFLSHPLVEFVFSLPDEFKLYQGWTKWILRDAMKNTLPDSITWRVDKIGYEPPQAAWLNSEVYRKKMQKGKEVADSLHTLRANAHANDWKYLMLSEFFNN